MRMRSFRINDEYQFRRKMKRTHAGKRRPSYKETGMVDHVDDGDVCDDDGYYEEDSHRMDWGRWNDCVPFARHEYWQSW